MASLDIETGNPATSNQPSWFPSGVTVYRAREDDGWDADGTLMTVQSGSSTRQVLFADTGVIYTRRSQSTSLWAAMHTVDLTAV